MCSFLSNLFSSCWWHSIFHQYMSYPVHELYRYQNRVRQTDFLKQTSLLMRLMRLTTYWWQIDERSLSFSLQSVIYQSAIQYVVGICLCLSLFVCLSVCRCLFLCLSHPVSLAVSLVSLSLSLVAYLVSVSVSLVAYLVSVSVSVSASLRHKDSTWTKCVAWYHTTHATCTHTDSCRVSSLSAVDPWEDFPYKKRLKSQIDENRHHKYWSTRATNTILSEWETRTPTHSRMTQHTYRQHNIDWWWERNNNRATKQTDHLSVCLWWWERNNNRQNKQTNNSSLSLPLTKHTREWLNIHIDNTILIDDDRNNRATKKQKKTKQTNKIGSDPPQLSPWATTKSYPSMVLKGDG